jgi:hypothetical protein
MIGYFWHGHTAPHGQIPLISQMITSAQFAKSADTGPFWACQKEDLQSVVQSQNLQELTNKETNFPIRLLQKCHKPKILLNYFNFIFGILTKALYICNAF